MRFLADEDFPLPAVQRLRQLGHDVVTIRDVGLDNEETPDHAVLGLASKMGLAVLTHNRNDFRRLHEESANHSGLVLCTHDRDFVRLADRIHAQVVAAGRIAGKVILVVRPNPA